MSIKSYQDKNTEKKYWATPRVYNLSIQDLDNSIKIEGTKKTTLKFDDSLAEDKTITFPVPIDPSVEVAYNDSSGSIYRVKASSADTNPTFLNSTLASADSSITRTIQNPGADETVSLQVNTSGININSFNGAPSGSVVGDSDSQVLTNKTITDPTNIVDANALKTTGASVNVSSAPPPAGANQILKTTSATTATWQPDATGNDEQVKVSANDTTATFLNDSLTVTSKLSKSIQNPSADENLQLDLGTVNIDDLNDVTITSLTEGQSLVNRSSIFVNEFVKNNSFNVLSTDPATAQIWKTNYIDLRVLNTMNIILPTNVVIGDEIAFRLWRIDTNTPTSFTLDAQAGNNVDAIDGSIVDTPGQTATYTLTGGSKDLEGQWIHMDVCTVSPIQWRLSSQSFTKLHQHRDVERATPTDNDVFVYNSGSEIWEHRQLTSASIPNTVVYTDTTQTITGVKTVDLGASNKFKIITDGDANFMTFSGSTTFPRIAIGKSTPSTRFEVQGINNEPQMNLIGHTTQTNPIMQVIDNNASGGTFAIYGNGVNGFNYASTNADVSYQLLTAGKKINFKKNTGATIATFSNDDENFGIGTSAPDSKAKLDLSSSTQGFLPPRLSTVERDAILTPPAGLMVYNKTTNKMNFYNGSAWEVITSA